MPRSGDVQRGRLCHGGYLEESAECCPIRPESGCLGRRAKSQRLGGSREGMVRRTNSERDVPAWRRYDVSPHPDEVRTSAAAASCLSARLWSHEVASESSSTGAAPTHQPAMQSLRKFLRSAVRFSQGPLAHRGTKRFDHNVCRRMWEQEPGRNLLPTL